MVLPSAKFGATGPRPIGTELCQARDGGEARAESKKGASSPGRSSGSCCNLGCPWPFVCQSSGRGTKLGSPPRDLLGREQQGRRVREGPGVTSIANEEGLPRGKTDCHRSLRLSVGQLAEAANETRSQRRD